MANYPFYFKVRLWNSVAPDKECISTGLGLSNSYAEAARQIEEYYGPELIAIEHLVAQEESDLIFLPESSCLEYVNSACPSVDFEQKVPKSE